MQHSLLWEAELPGEQRGPETFGSEMVPKNTNPCAPYCLGVPFPEWATWVPLQYTVSCVQKHDTR